MRGKIFSLYLKQEAETIIERIKSLPSFQKTSVASIIHTLIIKGYAQLILEQNPQIQGYAEKNKLSLGSAIIQLIKKGLSI